MHHLIKSLAAIAGLVSIPAVHAIPFLEERASITTLTTTQITAFTPYTWFASAGYCTPATIATWSCGANCNANPGFEVVASGGNGDTVQYYYVGYYPTTGEVIVAHQGTNVDELAADLTDLDFILAPLDSTLFPGLSSSILTHQGFADEQAKTATTILAAVTSALATYKTTKVVLVGHSLGAALSLLDSVYLPLHLPSTTTFTTYGYGLPRVGNQAFANYVDANLRLTHVNNKEDLIPILPFEIWGYVHPAGEVHIQDSLAWDACPGQDNSNALCICGDVVYLWDGNLNDHDGPYNGITMGC